MFYLGDSPVYCLLLIALCTILVTVAFLLEVPISSISWFTTAVRSEARWKRGLPVWCCVVCAAMAVLDVQLLSQLSSGYLARSECCRVSCTVWSVDWIDFSGRKCLWPFFRIFGMFKETFPEVQYVWSLCGTLPAGAATGHPLCGTWSGMRNILAMDKTRSGWNFSQTLVLLKTNLLGFCTRLKSGGFAGNVQDELCFPIVRSWVGADSYYSLAGVHTTGAAGLQEEDEDLGMESRMR